MLNATCRYMLVSAALGAVFAVSHGQTSTKSGPAPSQTPQSDVWTISTSGSFPFLLVDNGTWNNALLQSTSFSGSFSLGYKANESWSFDLVDYRDNLSYTNLLTQKSSTFNPGVTWKYAKGSLFAVNPTMVIDTIEGTQRGSIAVNYDLSSNVAFLPKPANPTSKNISFIPLVAFVAAATPYGLDTTTQTYQNVKMDIPLKLSGGPDLSLTIDPTFYYLPDVVGVKSTSMLTYKLEYTPSLAKGSNLLGNVAFQYSNGSSDASYGPSGFTGSSKLSLSAGVSFKWQSKS